MILKIRTGWDADDRELFEVIADVAAVEDRGCIDADELLNACHYTTLPNAYTRKWVDAEKRPRVLIVSIKEETGHRTYVVLDAYLCNDQGTTINRYCAPWFNGRALDA